MVMPAPAEPLYNNVNVLTWLCREEAEAKAKREKHAQLTAEGKTDQAKADLARLARIRKEREEAERRRQEEAKGPLRKHRNLMSNEPMQRRTTKS